MAHLTKAGWRLVLALGIAACLVPFVNGDWPHLRSGNYAIYPAELRRVFPSIAKAAAGVAERGASTVLFPTWDVS